MTNLVKRLTRRAITKVVRGVTNNQLNEKTSPCTKVALKSLFMNYRSMVHRGERLPSVWDTGFRVFSQFDEDGITIFLLAVVGISTGKFVDIGAGDGVWASNCSNLALNFGFHGLFIDSNESRVSKGREFYRNHPDTRSYPPKFRHTMVKRNNINQLIREEGFEGEIDVLSIDIDGNDYWIWEAIECVSPRIVVIETKVEFGMNSIVVPYDENFVWHPGLHPHYLGASPMAMTKLAKKLGYRTVGANRFGFNVFYLRNDLGTTLIPEIEVSELFRHDRNRERIKLFEEIKDYTYELV
jgi:hypothetical protein